MAFRLNEIFNRRTVSRIFAAGVAVGLIAASSITDRAQGPKYDLLIVGGHIIDGSGSPWYAGSVAIKDGLIADIGRLEGATAKRVIDAKGLVVAPGFIDLHSHSDYTLLVDGNAESKIRQGVTTEILGEASSAGPVIGPAIGEFDRSSAPLSQKGGIKRD